MITKLPVCNSDPVSSGGNARSGSLAAVALALFGLLSAAGLLPAASGDLDRSFNPGTNWGDSPFVFAVAVARDGRVIVGGTFTSINGTNRSGIARLNANGSLDTSFDPGTGANDAVWVVALQTDGKVIVGGDFTQINGTNRSHIARLNADGSLDTTFDPGTGAQAPPSYVPAVYSIVLQTNGQVLLGGYFTAINGTNRSSIARLNADGSLDNLFNASIQPQTVVFSTAAQIDGKVLVGGNFTTINGTNAHYFARLNADGSLDATFNPGTGADGPVLSITAQSSGQVLLGGDFDSINGTNRQGIARLNADGSLDTAFNPGSGANGHVESVAVQTDGKVLAGGFFSTINGTNRPGIARLNTDGSLDNSFAPTGSVAYIQSLALQTDGKVLVGGALINLDGTNRLSVARLLGDPVVLKLRATRGQIVLSWTNTAFGLQAAPTVAGLYTNVPGATSPYTNLTTDPRKFFRLKAN